MNTRGLGRVTKAINNFSHNKFHILFVPDDQFCNYIDNGEGFCTYGFAINKREQKCMYRWLAQTFDYNPNEIPFFIMCLLHEIGHAQTENDFTDEEWETYSNNVMYFDDAFENDEELEDSEFDDLCCEYYDMPQEKAAWVWAFDYVKSHRGECVQLWKRIRKPIREFLLYRMKRRED